MSEKAIKIRTITAPPTKNLEDTIGYAKTLYSQYSHNKFSKTEIASVLNFSANSGGFSYVFSALRAFGLIIPDRDGFKVSDLFKKINLSERDSQEFKKYTWEAVNIPTLYADYINEFKPKLPPEHIIAQRLELNKKMSPRAANAVAKIFEDSIRFTGLLDTNNNILPIRDSQTPIIDSGSGSYQSGSSDNIAESRTDEGIKQESSSTSNLNLQIPLSNDRIVKIIYPFDLTDEEAQKIAKVLSAIAGWCVAYQYVLKLGTES